MAFLYPIGVKIERYEDDFHFWYVNGFHPDPAIKQEVVEEKPMEEMKEDLWWKARGWVR